MKKNAYRKEKKMHGELLNLLQKHFNEDEEEMKEDMMDSYDECPAEMEDEMMEPDKDLDKEKKKQMAIIVISKKMGKNSK